MKPTKTEYMLILGMMTQSILLLVLSFRVPNLERGYDIIAFYVSCGIALYLFRTVFKVARNRYRPTGETKCK